LLDVIDSVGAILFGESKQLVTNIIIAHYATMLYGITGSCG